MFKKIYPILCLVRQKKEYETVGSTAKNLYNEGLISFDPELGQFVGDFDEIVSKSTLSGVSKVMTEDGIRFCIRENDNYINPVDLKNIEGTELKRW